MKKTLSIIISFILIFSFIFSYPFFVYASSEITYSYDDNSDTLTISGSGKIEDFSSSSNQPWNAYSTVAKNLVIDDGITYIGNNAFRQFTSVISVQFPETLTEIGEYSFYHASSIKNLIFPSSISKLGKCAFTACDSLSSIEFVDMSSSVYLSLYVFLACDKLLDAQFPFGTVYSDACVGYKDEVDKTLTKGFTLHGKENSTAYYYALNNNINFSNKEMLNFNTTFYGSFHSYTQADLYEYTPNSTGQYNLYSMGDVDNIVEVYDSSMTTLIATNDDVSYNDLNFDLTLNLTANETYVIKILNNHSLGNYYFKLYPSKITSIVANLPTDFILYESDAQSATANDGSTYSYYDLTKKYKDILITVTYDTGYSDTFYYNENEYNRSSFSIVDNQKISHFVGGTNYIDLVYKNITTKIPVILHIHSYSLNHTEPTCTQDGIDVYTCSCGDTYSTILNALGHNLVEEFKIATCTEGGYYYTYCSRCNEKLSETEYSYPTGHNYIISSQKLPTLSQDGYTTYNCSNCNDSYTVYPEKTGVLVSGKIVLLESPNGDYSNNIPFTAAYIKSNNLVYSMDNDSDFSFYFPKGENTIKFENNFGPNNSVTINLIEDTNIGSIALCGYDFNQDGYVNSRDYALFANICDNIPSSSEDYIEYLDFNRDSVMNASDANGMKNFYTYGKLDASIYK